MHELLARLSSSADALARRDGWPAPVIFHLVLALLEEPEIASVVERVGADVASYRAAIAARAVEVPREAAGLESVCEWIESNAAAQQKPVTPKFTMVLLLRSVLKNAFATTNVQPVDLAQILAHGGVTSSHGSLPRARLVGGRPRWFRRRGLRYQVVLHDDEFTTGEFVTTLLIDQFGLSPPIAKQVVQAVGESGKASLGQYRLDRALALIDQAHESARTAGFPLRFTCEPV